MHITKGSVRPSVSSLRRRQRYGWILLTAMVAITAMLAAPAARAVTSTTTTLELSDSSGPLSSGSSVSAGTVVTFTASVDSGAVTTGLVSFCDTSVNSYCDNSALIGTAQLTSGGTAVISFVPGMGSHSYVAVFSGTTSYATSTSTAVDLTVTGYRTTSAISTPSGSAGSYNLSGTVIGWRNSNEGPTGSVSFVDTTNSISGNTDVFGSAALTTAGSSQAAFAANSPLPYTVGGGPYAVAVGDFNGDGIPDLAVTNYGDKTVSILLGNGDGTFTPGTTISTAEGEFESPIAVAVGDFTGDGNLGLAVANYNSGTVSVLLGNGNGSFTLESTPAVGTNPRAVVVADFNGDGIPDLAIANYNNDGAGTVTVLIGDGTGNFSTKSTPNVGTGPRSVAVGDFNGDGIPDLAVANYGDSPGTVSVLLGNGDGTFTASLYSPYTVGSSPTYVAVGDFKGNGKADLVVTNGESNNVSVLLNIYSGSGSDPFATSSSSTFPTYETGSIPWGVAIGNFFKDALLSHDGIVDLAVVNCNSGSVGGCNGSTATGSVTLLPGNGDGTFCDGTPSNCPNSEATSTLSVGAGPVRVAVGDFNGDGLPDLAVTNYDNDTSTAGVNILLNGVTWTATWSATNVAVPGTGTTDNVVASYPGDTNFASSTSTAVSLTTSTSALSITASSTTMTYGSTPPTINPLYTYGSSVNTATPPGSGTAPTCVTSVSSSSSAGTYAGANTCSGASFSGYTTTSYVAGTMTVNPAVLVITATSATILVGAPVPTISPIYTGFVNGQSAGSLSTQPTCSTTATSSSGPGNYPSTCSGAVDSNYAFSYVSGLVTVVSSEALVSLSPSSLTFPVQTVGSTSAVQTVTLTNTGNASLKISSITASGDFSQANNCGSTVSAGNSCLIAVAFTPETAGTINGGLMIVDNAAGSPQTVFLTGTGLAMTAGPHPPSPSAPGLTPSSASLTFPTQVVNTSSSPQVVWLTNTGKAPLVISSITARGDFSQTNTCGTAVSAGSICGIAVIFTPAAVGTRTGALVIVDNAAGSPDTITLSGTGMMLEVGPNRPTRPSSHSGSSQGGPTLGSAAPVVTFSSPLLIFSDQVVGSSSTQTVTLTNTGDTPVAITGISTTGDFSETNTCGRSVSAGGSCTISVTFKPGAAGTKTGTLSISDDPSGTPETVALSGTGLISKAGQHPGNSQSLPANQPRSN